MRATPAEVNYAYMCIQFPSACTAVHHQRVVSSGAARVLMAALAVDLLLATAESGVWYVRCMYQRRRAISIGAVPVWLAVAC